MIGEAISLQVEAVAVTDVEMESPLKAELEVVAGIEVVVGIKAAIEIEGKELHFHACMGKFQAPWKNILHQIYKEVQISYQLSLFQETFISHYVWKDIFPQLFSYK